MILDSQLAMKSVVTLIMNITSVSTVVKMVTNMMEMVAHQVVLKKMDGTATVVMIPPTTLASKNAETCTISILSIAMTATLTTTMAAQTAQLMMDTTASGHTIK